MNPEAVVKSIMTTKLTTISKDEPVRLIQSIFIENDFHHIPVVDQGSQLVGMVSKQDFYKVFFILAKNTAGKIWTQKEFGSLTAKDIMTKYPIKLDPDDTIGLAADLFLGNKFHALPIVEDGQLLGILTSHDIMAYCFG